MRGGVSDADVTNADERSGDELSDDVLLAIAERALQRVPAESVLRLHGVVAVEEVLHNLGLVALPRCEHRAQHRRGVSRPRSLGSPLLDRDLEQDVVIHDLAGRHRHASADPNVPLLFQLRTEGAA